MPEPDLAGNAAGTGGDLAPQQREAAAEGQPLTALTWNIEWLGDVENGPKDEARQLALAVDSLTFADADLIGLQEVASTESARALADAFPAHAIELADYDQRQKVALLYRTARLDLLSVSTIEGLDDAGRPPLEARLRLRSGRELSVVVLHAKAGDDLRSYQIRRRFAKGLAAYLERRHAAGDVLLLGDFNDQFSSSTVEGSPSPYRALTQRGAFVATTAAIERDAERSTRWGVTVDHIVLSRSLEPAVVPGSIETLRDELLARHADFFEAASDHAPVVLELRL